MADPLSLTLATITLATALKDLVELAQLIEESFEKVSRNARELRSLASEVKMTVIQLKQFSDDHYDILCSDVDMKVALSGLLTDMRIIYHNCRDMFPQVAPKTLGKLKIAFAAWMKRNKMEEDIKNLRNRVNKCHSQFMIFAVMRIEGSLVIMRRQNHEDFRQIRQAITAINVSDDNVVAFMGSNTRILSKLPPEISTDIISEAYLSLRVDAIDGMLNQLSSNSYPAEEPLPLFLDPYQPILVSFPGDKSSIRQEIIILALQIESYLRTDSQYLSIQSGALYMITFCVGLQRLRMHEEAVVVSRWTVNLFRTLAKKHPEIYLPYLVHSLSQLSTSYGMIDDMDKSFIAIEEAVKISRELQSSSSMDPEIKFQLGKILTTLAIVWRRKGNNIQSFNSALEAVDIYESATVKNPEKTSCDHLLGLYDNPWTYFFEGISDTAMISYGYALKQLSFTFRALGSFEDAFNTAKKALEIMMFSASRSIDDSLDLDIAFLLCRISHQDYQKFLPLEEALSFSKRGVALYRLHSDTLDNEEDRMYLCKALCEQACILGKLGKLDEAVVLCREAAQLAKDILTNQILHAEFLGQLSSSLRTLKCHDEAVSARTESVTLYSRNKVKRGKEAHAYFDLGVELRLAGKRSEAIKALQAALTQYRALAFKEPEIYTKYIGRTLNQLTSNYIHSGQFDHAFNEGHESLKLHESILENDSSVLDEYMFALRLNSLAAEVADDEDKCIERARYNVMCARKVAKLHPTEGNIVFSQMVHGLANVLCHFNRGLEAGTIIEEPLDWHEANPPQGGKEVTQYLTCLTTKAIITFNQGHLKEGLRYIQKSIDVGESHSSHKSVPSILVASMRVRIQMLPMAGLTAEAMEASKAYVAFARQHQNESPTGFIKCLLMTVLAFRYDRKFDEALVYLKEALRLSRSDELVELSKTQPLSLLLLSESLAFFCEILADIGQESEALIEGKAAVDYTLELKSKYATLPWTDIAPLYYHALDAYSLRLAASGDLPGALDKLAQVRCYYESRIHGHPVECMDLAHVLYEEGIIYCAAGRPDEGAAAIAKLHNLQERLRIPLPELAQHVKIWLERHRSFPSWVALNKKLDLKCGHEH